MVGNYYANGSNIINGSHKTIEGDYPNSMQVTTNQFH